MSITRITALLPRKQRKTINMENNNKKIVNAERRAQSNKSHFHLIFLHIKCHSEKEMEFSIIKTLLNKKMKRIR